MSRKMKDSGIEWIGDIPEEWSIKKVGLFYNIVLGKMVNNDIQEDSDNYLCAANIKWNGVDTSIQKKMYFSNEEKALYLLSDGDVLIMEGGLAGTTCIYNGEFAPCYIQNSVHRCRARTGSFNKYLYYWMYVVYYSGYINSICNKATIMHYTKEKLNSTPIIVTALSEQIAISSYLDTKCAHIDNIIEKTKASIEEYKKLKQAVITQAVTKGIRGDRPMKDSGIEWIGEIPEEWAITNAHKIIVNTQNGLTRRDLDKSSGTVVLKLKNISSNGEIDYSYINRIELTKEELSKYTLIDGDFIFVRVNGSKSLVGKCSIFKKTTEIVAYNDHIIRVRLNSLMNKEFFKYYLISKVGRIEIDLRTSTAAGQFTISGEGLRDITVIIPNLLEQKEIAAYLDKKCAEIDAIITKKQQFITEMESYKKSMIYEYVTGKREVLQ